ncbi:MAG TPA: hypothetical protein VL400_05320 [Polyangiaceae bacterium]|jgi:hypothetical protein|nr:hypothetical protein [Polyangiaceae bacterium]
MRIASPLALWALFALGGCDPVGPRAPAGAAFGPDAAPANAATSFGAATQPVAPAAATPTAATPTAATPAASPTGAVPQDPAGGTSRPPQPAPTATTIAELGTKKPIPGCFCEFERDRIEVSIPCGVTTCVDDQSLTCGADKQVVAGDPCQTSAACFCTVDLDEDNTMQIACGLTACAEGTSFTCTSDGKTKRNGACQ